MLSTDRLDHKMFMSSYAHKVCIVAMTNLLLFDYRCRKRFNFWLIWLVNQRALYYLSCFVRRASLLLVSLSFYHRCLCRSQPGPSGSGTPDPEHGEYSLSSDSDYSAWGWGALDKAEEGLERLLST